LPIHANASKIKRVRILHRRLIETAKFYLEDRPDSRIKEVYFLCWTDKDLEACQQALEQAGLAAAAAI
jgi:hypothetical protein